jgi:hypothetical protein
MSGVPTDLDYHSLLIPGRNLDLLARWRDYRRFRGHNFASP